MSDQDNTITLGDVFGSMFAEKDDADVEIVSSHSELPPELEAECQRMADEIVDVLGITNLTDEQRQKAFAV